MTRPAAEVARMILRRQRGVAGHPGPGICRECADDLAREVGKQMLSGGPLSFILPAFPAKSPNPEKVLGHLPDLADELALTSLDALFRGIAQVYGPGARLILCSDGRVFSDVVGIADEMVTEYQQGVRDVVESLRLDSISLWSLDEVYPGLTYHDMRLTLMFNYGESIAALRKAISQGGHFRHMYRGITRFLYEDADRSNSIMSKSALQRACRRRAYDVIARSQAWSALLERRFPGVVRLSIHPQPCGTAKFGIHLTDRTDGDQWLTPWHCVAVHTPEGYRFMKRRDAEAAGAVLVHRSGQPSHYTMIDDPRPLARPLTSALTAATELP